MEGDGGRGEEKTYTFLDATLPFFTYICPILFLCSIMDDCICLEP
jgi:hypothetical protein